MAIQEKNYNPALMAGATNSDTTPQAITSASNNALVVGANGATNPVLNIDTSTSSVATGINIAGAAAAGGVAISVLSSGTNENLTIDAKGSGTVTINGTATGAVTITPATTITGALTSSGGIVVASAKKIEGAGTGTNGIILKNLKNAAAGTLSGTALNVEIDIGGTPYYFAVYPTKS